MKIRVNVLELLDTHWMLFQQLDESKLKATSPAGAVFFFDFKNDGTNLFAEYSDVKTMHDVTNTLMANSTKFVVDLEN